MLALVIRLIIVALVATFAYGGFQAIRSAMNESRAKLDELGLPFTFSNVFFLSANKERAAREQRARILAEVEGTLGAELSEKRKAEEADRNRRVQHARSVGSIETKDG